MVDAKGQNNKINQFVFIQFKNFFKTIEDMNKEIDALMDVNENRHLKIHPLTHATWEVSQ